MTKTPAPVKVAVVGTGYMGTLHAKKLANIANAQLIGVFDIDPIKKRDTAEIVGTKPFDTLDDAIKAADAIVLASSSSTHGKIGMQIIENGVHLLIEKPITASVEEAEVLVELAAEKNIVLKVGHIENFNPALAAARKFIDNPIFIEAHRLTSFRERGTDVSVVEDLMIHDLEILARICGTQLESMDVSQAQVLTSSPDISNVRLKFSTGCVANLTASRLSLAQKRKMRIFQKDAYITIDFAEKAVTIAQIASKYADDAAIIKLGSKNVELFSPSVEKYDQLERELADFIDAVRKPHFEHPTSAIWALTVSKAITEFQN